MIFFSGRSRRMTRPSAWPNAWQRAGEGAGGCTAFTNTGTANGRLLFVETPAGRLERWLDEIGEPVGGRPDVPAAA